jgi:hypothetical protein
MSFQINILQIAKNRYFILFVLWFSLTAININKAFHIDDTFHIEAAMNLTQDPLRPMSALVNWSSDPKPLFNFNQPPLFYYLIASYANIFGYSEISLHLFLSFFTFFALFFFQEITFLLPIKKKMLLLVIFAFNPAFIINQNVMADVPLIAIILGSIYFIIKAKRSGKTKNYLIAATFIGVGMLLKYSILPMLIVLLLVILLNKDYKNLIVLLIPIGLIALWSLWNYLEIGHIHITNRPQRIYDPENIWVFLSTVGAVSTFIFSFFYGVFRSKFSEIFILTSLLLFIGSVIFVFLDFIFEKPYTAFLYNLFMLTGVFVYLAIVIIIYKKILLQKLDYFISDHFIIILSLLGLSAFILLYAPIYASRQILLIIPFLLLSGSQLFDKSTPLINGISLTATIILGVVLGISDWNNADYYREIAASIELNEDEKTWSAGHWGWQWYAKANGMEQYHTQSSDIKDGDYIIYPVKVDKQNKNPETNWVIIDKIWKKADILTFFSGKTETSFYSAFKGVPTWNLSKQAIDTIYVCKVEKGISFNIRRIKNDKIWLQKVNEKAIRKGIPLDSMLILDAIWLMNAKKEKELKNKSNFN